MVTVISYRGSDYAYNVHLAFAGDNVNLFIDKAQNAMNHTDFETAVGFISVETFGINGLSENAEVFASVESATEWWSTK